jgi:glycosyltransferase involved in cell wall biosynthesis
VVDERPRSAREGPPHPWLEVRRTFPVVVTAGRIAKEKDFPTLLAAIAQLQNRRPVRLIILGDGVDAPNLRNQIANLGLSQRVFLAGTVQDIRPWLQYCDLFALSSQYEGFGNVLVEALAEGCRIVSTDCPFGPREILKGGKFGKLVPVGDIDALAHAIECYLCTAVDQEALRNRSLDFTIEKSMKAYNQLFEQLVYYSVSKSRHSQK